MKLISGLIKLAAVAVIVVFSIMNTESVSIKYFYNIDPITLPVFIVVLSALLLGVLVSGLLYSMDRFSLKRQIGKLNKHIKKQDDELVRLRNIPFEEPKDMAKREDS